MSVSAKDRLKVATTGAATEFTPTYNPKPHVQNAAFKAPGRLGEPKMELEDEPRVNAALLPTLKNFQMGKHAYPTAIHKLNENSSIDEIGEMIAEFENGVNMLYSGGVLPMDQPEDKHAPKIEMEKTTIKNSDGEDMFVYVYRPANQSEPLPGVVYYHGGGMTILTTQNPIHDWWCKSLAAQGCVVAMPDFRNAFSKNAKGDWNHFPTPLNDCVAAAKWVIAHRSELRMRNVVFQGESGGANLSLATALTANREGWVGDVAGVFGIVPYISGAYGWPEEKLLGELPSLVECNGYFLDRPASAYMAHFYTPNDKDQESPLAWPYFATVEDMKGLPPHVLVMDELDPLRDEGVSYARRLAKAGVDAKGSINLGVVHGTSLIFRGPAKPFNRDAIRSIVAFARDFKFVPFDVGTAVSQPQHSVKSG